ncbi:mucin-3A-like isoform X2 [Equus asinus]|uniref:mucin-3A-like isoform X2 n=1 Tax=Equus asinus TaxID=9793 RepID=UPI0038F7C7DF
MQLLRLLGLLWMLTASPGTRGTLSMATTTSTELSSRAEASTTAFGVTTTYAMTPSMSPMLTSTRPTPSSSLSTSVPGTCENDGTWIQDHCLCPPGFSGDHCERQDSVCQNGGRWDGLKCVCPSTFYGIRCQFAVEQMDLETVDAEVGMEVAVDQEFFPDLHDNTSKAYKDFSNIFRSQMQKIYQNVQGFKDVEILSLRNGSIVVDYVVLLELPFRSQLETNYEMVKMVLKGELQNVSQDVDSCQKNQNLCFKPDSIMVKNDTSTELTPKAICYRAAPKGYEDYYFPLEEEKRLRCVSKCTSDVEGAIDCNQGWCFVQKSGPQCSCFSTDTHWFLGPRCEVAVQWRALVGGLAGAGALLLLLLLVAGTHIFRRSRRRGGPGGARSWDYDKRWFEVWDEDTAGTFSNSGFQDDRPFKDENFQVALEKVDTNVRVHTQRPEVDLSSL